jgi:hypothetical protein
MTPDEALSFVETQGVVLASAKGPVPRMAEIIAGEPIQGSWWAHPKGREIFQVLQVLENSPDILVCRIVGGKITLVHRRLWPAVVSAAGRFPADHLAKTSEEHTGSGRHVRRDVPFPDWVDAETSVRAASLAEEEALAALGSWTRRP